MRFREDALKPFRKNVKNEEAIRSKGDAAVCTMSALSSLLNGKP